MCVQKLSSIHHFANYTIRTRARHFNALVWKETKYVCNKNNSDRVVVYVFQIRVTLKPIFVVFFLFANTKYFRHMREISEDGHCERERERDMKPAHMIVYIANRNVECLSANLEHTDQIICGMSSILLLKFNA